MPHSMALPGQRRRAVLLATAVLGAALIWIVVMHERRPEPSALTKEHFIQAILRQAEQAGRRVVSVETPSMWVRIENPEPMEKTNSLDPPRDICITHEGEFAEFVTLKGERVFLRYKTLDNRGGTAELHHHQKYQAQLGPRPQFYEKTHQPKAGALEYPTGADNLGFPIRGSRTALPVGHVLFLRR